MISHQFLSQARWGPVIGDGVEGGVFARHHRVGDDHAVTFVDPQAISTFHFGGQVGVLGVRQQSAHFIVILEIRAGCVVFLAAVTLSASFAKGRQIWKLLVLKQKSM